MNTLKRKRPRTEPWDTPEVTLKGIIIILIII
jgi:hypothetical protein